MQLSSKGRYAVMAMADLADEAARLDPAQSLRPRAIAQVSERQAISQAFLEQIFMKLRRAGLVTSSRGPGGGYMLARDAAEISILEIMEAVEEPVQMTRCSLTDVGGCVSGKRCLTHGLWQDLGLHIKDFLKKTSLADVILSASEFVETIKIFEATAEDELSSAGEIQLNKTPLEEEQL
ncbi:MAG: Rrf2 family transcriptional regulator [Rhodomicrobiaceae bacterium]|jgi:Rrf2 family iron-sulfur cluster assembly transcriptional regulator